MLKLLATVLYDGITLAVLNALVNVLYDGTTTLPPMVEKPRLERLLVAGIVSKLAPGKDGEIVYAPVLPAYALVVRLGRGAVAVLSALVNVSHDGTVAVLLAVEKPRLEVEGIVSGLYPGSVDGTML